MDQRNFSGFKWINPSAAVFKWNELAIHAPAGSDFFCVGGTDTEGNTPDPVLSAPFFYTEVAGDFVMRVRTHLEFKDTYDSSTIMVMKDFNVWAKACFEKTDFDTHAVVSVVTNGTSDDANGCNIDAGHIWLQVCRVGSTFAFHYSTDNINYYMMRYFSLPAGPVLKAGLVAQAPRGAGGPRYFSNFSLEKKTVADIRAGR